MDWFNALVTMFSNHNQASNCYWNKNIWVELKTCNIFFVKPFTWKKNWPPPDFRELNAYDWKRGRTEFQFSAVAAALKNSAWTTTRSNSCAMRNLWKKISIRVVMVYLIQYYRRIEPCLTNVAIAWKLNNTSQFIYFVTANSNSLLNLFLLFQVLF